MKAWTFLKFLKSSLILWNIDIYGLIKLEFNESNDVWIMKINKRKLI
jgi:hypothetical protein